MNIYVTADLHLNHSNMIDLVGRPFENVDQMNSRLVKYINNRTRYGDVLYHIGDFMFGGTSTYADFLSDLRPRLIHIMGNHDWNNGVKEKTIMTVIKFAGRKIGLIHSPWDIAEYGTELVDAWLCGHVHTSWTIRRLEDKVPILNVGVDVHNYQPLKMTEVIVMIDKYGKSAEPLFPSQEKDDDRHEE